MKRRTLLVVTLALMVGLELCFLAAAFSDSHINDRRAARAFGSWLKDPSPETEAVWKREGSRARRNLLILDSTLYVLIAANGIGIYYVSRKFRVPGKI